MLHSNPLEKLSRSTRICVGLGLSFATCTFLILHVKLILMLESDFSLESMAGCAVVLLVSLIGFRISWKLIFKQRSKAVFGSKVLRVFACLFAAFAMGYAFFGDWTSSSLALGRWVIVYSVLASAAWKLANKRSRKPKWIMKRRE